METPEKPNNILQIQTLTKGFNAKEGKVIDAIDVRIQKGAVVSLLGESGSGKTPLARLIAGLEVPDSGEIILDGETVSNSSTFIVPQERQVGMVFQDYALFPHMTVLKNVGYGLPNTSEKNQRVLEMLALVNLQDLGHRYPHQLSGGQQQRVALARALAAEPKLLLLDEPFSNLDASLKRHLRSEVFQIIRKSNVTAIFLTHDTQDAMAVSDTVIVLQSGKIIQQGIPKDLYENPSTLYIAALFGPITTLSSDDLLHFNLKVSSEKKYAIRQNGFEINPQEKQHTAEVVIQQSTYLGDYFLNQGMLPNKKIIPFVSKQKLQNSAQIGIEADQLMVFDET